MSKKTTSDGAMGFFHEKGFVPSFRQASKFADKKGHVGTMLDVVDARLATPPYKKLDQFKPSQPTPWDQYYTTMSAEYLGMSKGGVKILIIAHGIGPMATEKGVVAAYKWESDDKTRNRSGGRISIDEFHKLESGHYGPIEIVEFEPYLTRYKYPFISILKASAAFEDPVIRARLGTKTTQYLTEHTHLAIEYYKQVHGVDPKKTLINPFIVRAGDPSNCSYAYGEVEDGYAFAHLLSIGQIVNAHCSDYGRLPTWSCDVGPYEWWNGTRMFGVQESGIAGIRKGPDAYNLLRQNWRELMEPSGLTTTIDGFFVLTQFPDKTWFTQVDKPGEGMDTNEPEFLVTSIENIGKPVQFSTDVRHYHGFFKYAKKEARAVLPPEANAYTLVGDPTNVWEDGNPVRQVCLVQAYRVEIDRSRRLVRKKVLANNYGRMMQLLEAA